MRGPPLQIGPMYALAKMYSPPLGALLPRRVWFLSCFGLKLTTVILNQVWFLNKNRLLRYLSFQLQMIIEKREIRKNYPRRILFSY